MNKKLILFILATFLSSCATIVSKSKYDVSVTSSPSEAKFSITKSNGVVVHSGLTPAIVPLASADGYFSKAPMFLSLRRRVMKQKLQLYLQALAVGIGEISYLAG
jgi:hypothetical protein